MARSYIRWFEDIGADDVASVGGKNASLGEPHAGMRRKIASWCASQTGLAMATRVQRDA